MTLPITGSAAVTAGRVARMSARLRHTTRTHPHPGIGPKTLRLVLRELLHHGEPVPAWQQAAACAAPGIDAEVFFPPDGWASDLAVAAAKRVCAGCPVRAACLADAMAWEHPHQRHGVAGGLTPAERSALADGGDR